MARNFEPRELGEFGLIESIRRRAGPAGRRWVLGIGDDAAVLRPAEGRDLVWTADALIEDVHFRWSTTDPKSLGHKALAVNLSDVAAMGARPLGFLLTLGFPGDTPGRRLDGFRSGLLAEARGAACPLVGGDTVRSPGWSLSISALGEVTRGAALRRDRARAGDRVLVTGSLGGSALGLQLLENGWTRTSTEKRFVRMHRRPKPPYEVGPRLARAGLSRAAIDVSDGLLGDLGHILSRSGVGADLQLDRLPLAPGFRSVCAARGFDPDALALRGGEDHQLLFTVRPDAPDASVLARRLDVRLSEIGVLRRESGIRLFRGDTRVSSASEGYDHFKPVPLRSDK